MDSVQFGRPVSPGSPKKRTRHDSLVSSPIACVSVQFDQKSSPIKTNLVQKHLSFFQELCPKPLTVSSAVLNSPSGKTTKKFDKYSILSSTTKVLTDDDDNNVNVAINTKSLNKMKEIRIPTVSMVDSHRSLHNNNNQNSHRKKKQASSMKRTKHNNNKPKPNNKRKKESMTNSQNKNETKMITNDDINCSDNNRRPEPLEPQPLEPQQSELASEPELEPTLQPPHVSIELFSDNEKQYRKGKYSIPKRQPLTLSLSSLQLNDKQTNCKIENQLQPRLLPKRSNSQKDVLSNHYNDRHQDSDNKLDIISASMPASMSGQNQTTNIAHNIAQKTQNGVLIALGKPILIPYLNNKWSDMLPNLFPATTPRPPSPKSLSFRKNTMFHPKQHKYSNMQNSNHIPPKSATVSHSNIQLQSFFHNNSSSTATRCNTTSSVRNHRLASPTSHAPYSPIHLSIQNHRKTSTKNYMVSRNLEHNTLLYGKYKTNVENESFQNVQDILSKLSRKSRKSKTRSKRKHQK